MHSSRMNIVILLVVNRVTKVMLSVVCACQSVFCREPYCVRFGNFV